jgi:hypothetical protein
MKLLVISFHLGAVLWSQVPNDTCATSILIAGTSVSGTNVGASTGPDPLPPCATVSGDVWYAWVAPCNATYTASTCAAATNFATIVAVWDGAASCGSLVPVACSDLCTSGAFQGAAASFVATAGTVYFISVGGISGNAGGFELSITSGVAMTLLFFSNGSGTLGYSIIEGPASGTAFVAMTVNQGGFPFGWFLGIDIGWLELMGQLSFGFPFVTPLSSCGLAVVGPAFGLPTGLQIFAVGVALPPAGTVPSATTLPTIGVVP